MKMSLLFIIVGFVLLIKGADFLVDGASNLAKKFHIPEMIIGLTIVSIGTSMPELFVSSTSGINGSSDMAIGNIIGSNLCNLLMILGISAILRPVIFQKETRYIEIPMCLAITIIFLFLCNTGMEVTRKEAVFLLILFILFILYTIVMAKKASTWNVKNNLLEIQTKEKPISLVNSISYIILGVIALKLGGDLTVKHATYIAQFFNVSEKIIGLTVLAIGTSLPELVTSVTASIKGNSDIAIGNIIGSNIFNILFIIGVSASLCPLKYNITYNIQMYILIISTILLEVFPCIPPKNKMSRCNGLLYLIIYIAYMTFLFL